MEPGKLQIYQELIAEHLSPEAEDALFGIINIMRERIHENFTSEADIHMLRYHQGQWVALDQLWSHLHNARMVAAKVQKLREQRKGRS